MRNNGMQMLKLKKNRPEIVSNKWEAILEHIEKKLTENRWSLYHYAAWYLHG